MIQKYEKRRKTFEYLLYAQTGNGDGADRILIYDEKTTLKCWGTFDGATVTVSVLAEDGTTWIPVYSFTAEGVQFGEVGSAEEEFKATISGAGASTELYCTMAY